jgi:16S rRNA processing protein RimM
LAENNALYLAQIGKTFGVNGLLKLRLDSDFPEFFAVGRTLKAVLGERERNLTINRFDFNRALIGFVGFDSPETAAALTNYELFTTIDETKKTIALKEGERFWFDLIGAPIVENGVQIATIERIDEGSEPLLTLTIEGKKRRLVIPYNDRFIIGAQNDVLVTQNVTALIEAL